MLVGGRFVALSADRENVTAFLHRALLETRNVGAAVAVCLFDILCPPLYSSLKNRNATAQKKLLAQHLERTGVCDREKTTSSRVDHGHQASDKDRGRNVSAE